MLHIICSFIWLMELCCISCVVLCWWIPINPFFVSRLSVLRTPFNLHSLVAVFFVRLTIRVVQFIWNPALQWRAKVRFKALCVKHFRFQNLFWIRYTTCDKVEMMRYGPCHLQLNLGLDGLLPFLRRYRTAIRWLQLGKDYPHASCRNLSSVAPGTDQG